MHKNEYSVIVCIKLAFNIFSFNFTKQGHLPKHFQDWQMRM